MTIALLGELRAGARTHADRCGRRRPTRVELSLARRCSRAPDEQADLHVNRQRAGGPPTTSVSSGVRG